MFVLLNEGLVIRMVKDVRQSAVLLTASRITLAGVITRRELRGTLETPNGPDRGAWGALPGATTNL